MSAQAPKLVAIGFSQASRNPRFQSLEELYAYGVLSQLARFSEFNYKDLATLPDKISLEANLSYDETLAKLQQLCRSARTQYAFTGVLAPVSDGEAVKLVYRLYEAQGNRYIVDEVVTLNPVASEKGEFEVAIGDLNRLINQTANQFIRAAFGDGHPGGQAQVSVSLNAFKLVLKAHQITDYAEKIRLYETAVQEDPHLETAYYHLARLYKSENEYEKSVLNYRKTLEVSQAGGRNKALYATDAGIACALLGKLDFALQWWMKAIEYDASYINPYFNIANTYEDQDHYGQAELYFLKAQELAPDDYRTFFNLARIYSKTGAWEKALTQYRRQLQTEDGDPWCHSDVATCYLNLGDTSNAKRHLEKTVVLDPEGEAGQYAQLILGGLG